MGSMNLPLIIVFLAALTTGCYGQDVVIGNDTTPLPYWNKPRITVCTCEWTPMVFCVNKTWDVYTGFEIEFFRGVAQKLRWTPDKIDWKCMGWEELIQDIQDYGGTNGNGTCDFAVAGFAAKSDLMRAGLVFTWPTTRVGKRIMVTAEKSEPGIWFFLSAISTEIWILLIVTAIITGLIIWFSEVGMEALNPDTRWLSNVMWDTAGRPVGMRDYRLSSNPANLVGFMWSFLVFIIMAMYTANLAANLTTANIGSDIRSLSDLPGKSVGTWEFYTQDLQKYNIISKGYPWDSGEDEVAMINELRVGNIQALIMESSMLSITDSTSCDTMLVGGMFDGVDVVAAFPRGFNDTELHEAYNKAVIELLNEGLADTLQKRFIDVPQAPCKSAQLESSSTSVQWGQVGGLWIMLGAAVGLAALLIGWKWLWKLKLKEKVARTKWGKRFVSDPGQKLNTIKRELLHVGTGNRRTPKSAQPRISYTQRQAIEAEWAEKYVGASKGYLGASRDDAAMEVRLDNDLDPGLSPHDPQVQKAAFESMVLRELALLKAELRQRTSPAMQTSPHDMSDKDSGSGLV